MTTSFPSPRGLLVFLLMILFLPLTYTQWCEDGTIRPPVLSVVKMMTCVDVVKVKKTISANSRFFPLFHFRVSFFFSNENNLFNVFYIDCYTFTVFYIPSTCVKTVYKNKSCGLLRYSMQPKFINKMNFEVDFFICIDYLVNLPTWIRIAGIMADSYLDH